MDECDNLSKKERQKLKHRERELAEIERAERVMAELRRNRPRHGDESEDENASCMSPTHLGGADVQVDPSEPSEPLRLHDWMRRERLLLEGQEAMATPTGGI